MTDVSGAFTGITTPTSELIDDIHRRGWTLNKVHVKDGNYVAVAKSPHKETLEATGRTEATAIGNVLVKVMRREHMRAGAVREKLGAWDHMPIEQQWAAIAQAYAQAPVYEPKAAPAWMDLAQDCQRRAQIIRMQIAVELSNDPVPYDTADDLREDVTKKRHITISRAYAHHPVWSEAQMLDYRLVVDVLGHAASAGDWGWHGTCLAFAQLAPLLAESPQKALFTELLGQSAFGGFYRNWGPQKICFLEDLIGKEQEKENKPGHHPVHPSQSIVPTSIPSIFSRVAAATRTQLLQQKQELENQWPDRSEVVHQWPDDWSVRKPTTYADIHRQGELLGNCLSLNNPACIAFTDHPNWPKDAEGEPVDSAEMLTPEQYQQVVASLDQPIPEDRRHWHESSLHDPDGLPHAVWSDGFGFVDDVMGRHNSMPKPEYLARASDYAQQVGMPPVGIDNVRVDDYPDLTDWEDHRQAAASSAIDPNTDWESGVSPLQDNAYLWQRQNGVDPLDAQGVTDALHPLESGIANMHPELMKQSVINALRGSLLGTRNNARGHAQHYQDLMHLPASVDDPIAFWDALEQRREQHNQSHGYAPNSHKQHWPEEQQFKQWVKAANPHLDDADVQREAKRELLHMLSEEEERILASDQPEQLPAEMIEHEAYEALRRRLKALTKPTVDQKVDFGDDHLYHEASKIATVTHECPHCGQDLHDNRWTGYTPVTEGEYGKRSHYCPNCQTDLREIEHRPVPKTSTHHADMYPPYLTSRMRPLAQLGRHADDLSEAARQDLLLHSGKGHHFRAQALNLGIPGLGPRQVSNAWLHLAPQTSQLGIVNPETAEILGHDYATDTTNRDYFKHERELAAGRDASGYGHIPLGAFSTGLWDQYAGGPGWHPDRTPLKAYAPIPHHTVDWDAQTPPMTGWTKPYWWESTQEARDGAAQDFDRSVATQYGRDEIPFQRTAAGRHQLGFRPNLITQRKQLWGRGLVHPDGTIWTWPEEEVDHQRMAAGLDIPDDTTRQFMISPQGVFSMHDSLDDEELAQMENYIAQETGLQRDPQYCAPSQPERLSAVQGRSPWVVNPSTAERLTGAPGTSLMTHIKQTMGHPSVHDVWNAEYEAGKGPAGPGTIAKVATGWLPKDPSDYGIRNDRQVTESDYERFRDSLRATPYGDISPFCDDQECYLAAEGLEYHNPKLKQEAGYYNHPEHGPGDHSWNIAPDGTIVDTSAIQHEPGHPSVIPPDHPYYKRYLSWSRHPDQTMSIAHNDGEHTPGKEGWLEECPQCQAGTTSRVASSRMYHIAPSYAREAIEQIGLVPGGKTHPEAHDRVYMSAQPGPGTYHHDGQDIWEIDAEGLPIAPGEDSDWEGMGEYFTTQPVPPERLRRLT